MSKIISSMAIAMMLLSTTSCYVRVNDKLDRLVSNDSVVVKPSGEEKTETFSFDAITSITMNCGDLEYVQSDIATPYVSITADKNFFDHIDVLNENGDLNIKVKIKKIRSSKDVAITVYTNEINGVTVAGAGDVYAKSIQTEYDDFKVSVIGAGELKIDSFKGNNMIVSINGAGDASLNSVEADDVTLSIAGAGDVDMNFIKANDVKASFSGSADIVLTGECNLVSGSGSGSGNIDIRHLKYNDSKISKSGAISVKQ